MTVRELIAELQRKDQDALGVTFCEHGYAGFCGLCVQKFYRFYPLSMSQERQAMPCPYKRPRPRPKVTV